MRVVASRHNGACGHLFYGVTEAHYPIVPVFRVLLCEGGQIS